MNEPRLRVGLYVNDPKASVLRLARCLRNWAMDFTTIWRQELKALAPGDVDVLLLHGGWYGIDRVPGQEQYEKREKPENGPMADAVRGFVASGGGIVGVCAGAFNVVWLGLVEADISRAQGCGMHALETVDETHPIVQGVVERAAGRKDRKWNALPVIRINGPIFLPRRREQMVMSYDWERRLGAILAASYGRGRAVAISPHPEFQETEVEGGPVLDGEPMRAALLLRNALLWSAGRAAPAG